MARVGKGGVSTVDISGFVFAFRGMVVDVRDLLTLSGRDPYPGPVPRWGEGARVSPWCLAVGGGRVEAAEPSAGYLGKGKGVSGESV